MNRNSSKGINSFRVSFVSSDTNYSDTVGTIKDRDCTKKYQITNLGTQKIGVDPALFIPERALVHFDDLDDVAHGAVEAVQPRGDEEGRAAQPRRPPAEVDPILLHPGH